MVLSGTVGFILKRKFNKFSEEPSAAGLTGREIAEKMLSDYGIHDVKVTCVPGQLTDHYNPIAKTVNLSESVYHESNAAAAAVAAHECGHAAQHANAYRWLKFRSAMVPVQTVSGMLLNIIMFGSIFIGAIFYEIFPYQNVLLILTISYGAMALFSLVTLPVEFDASKRALVWIQNSGTATHGEYQKAKSALNWAATTYVVAALGAITTMLFFLLQFLGADE